MGAARLLDQEQPRRVIPRRLPREGDGVQLAAGHGEILQAGRAAGAWGDAVGPQAEQRALLLVGRVVRVGRGDLEVGAGLGRAGVQPLPVEEGAPAPCRRGQLVAGGGVRPGGQQDAASREGDQRAEAVVAVHELAGAVDGVDDPDGGVGLYRVVRGRVGVHRFLADHDRAGQERAERLGEVLLGEPVGVGHQVVRSALLVDLVRGELPEARHDLGRGRLTDRFRHVGRVLCEKLVDGFVVFDHPSMRARPTDNPRPAGERQGAPA